jgi:putative membrane protein
MKTHFPVIFTSLFISAILFTSCNSGDSIKQANAANTHSPDMVPSGKVNSDDAKFATEAASGGMMEVEMGKLCIDHTKNTEVENFGAMMVEDHTIANNDLMNIAAGKNLVLPAIMSDKDQKMVDNMRNKSGSDFDKSYINMMINDHVEDIANFKKEASGGKDADISSFATRILPTLQKHLDAAKAAQKVI